MLLCSQFIYMLFHIVYMMIVCARSSMVFFNVWSILSSKAKKIEILMNQIKSTKRLTIDNFTRNIQTHIRFYCASTLQSLEAEEKEEDKKNVDFAEIPSSKNQIKPTFDSSYYSVGLFECSKMKVINLITL